jgi:hypothetical protein
VRGVSIIKVRLKGGENINYLEVVPAYGRDYKNQSEIKADWSANKDFQDPFRGSYLNKSDAERLGIKVLVRYARQSKVFAVN